MKGIRAIIGERETVTVESLTSIVSAARLMADRQIGAMPVVDGGRLVGIISERDVLTRVVATGLDPAGTTVSEVMSSNLIVAEVHESYEACFSRMREAHVRHLIVLDNGALAGILSLRDLMAADLDDKAEAITLLNSYVHYIPADLQPKAR